MIYKYIIAIDPSGNFEEGKGTTGCCLFSAEQKQIITTWNIRASDYSSKEAYWNAHLDMLKKFTTLYKNSIVVMEDFTLNPKRALQQSHSKMETSKLIGVIQMACAEHSWPLKMQLPVEAKTRWPDSFLERKHFIKKLNKGHCLPSGQIVSRHEKDAIRHAVHYSTFYNK